jgi:hypothetical protein
MNFDINKTQKTPLFDQSLQLQIVKLNPDKLQLMKNSKDIKEWNNNREIVIASFKDLITQNPRNEIYCLMLMGYIDGYLFQTLKS